MNKSTYVLGTRVDITTRAEATARIKAALSERKHISIFTPNPTMVIRAHGSEELREVLNSAELSVADGVGVILASRILGDPLPERIAGIELGEDILRLANENKLKVFLLGGRPGVADRAAKNIRVRYPDINICGTHHGYFEKSGADNDEVVQRIKIAAPDVLIVCFGFPAQETWILQNRAAIPSLLLCTGLGGSIDVWAGDVRRAPRAVRALSLEWLWRIVLQPKRAKDLLLIIRFLLEVLRQKIETSHKRVTKRHKQW